jgi:signal peptidase I
MREDSGKIPVDPRLAPGQPPPSAVNGPASERIATGEPLHPAAAAEADKKVPEQKDAFREIVETVVFVVVLVLLLKAFMAEAFVIPTGSMAPTLLGYHREIKCPECGFRFPVNMSKQYDAQETQRERITGCECPNCRLFIDGNNSKDFQAP